MTERLTYVLPIRSRPGGEDEASLTDYLRWMSERADVVIVDGSDPETFARHRVAWGRVGTHVPPADDLRCANGKAWGVLTGVRVARSDLVLIADDDVRYDDETLREMGELLRRAELVRPQNYFHPLPWHARWDTARILLNRAVGGDYPGTLGVRRSFLLAIGGYDGDVLFENLELIRTVEAAGGRVLDAPSVFVRRRPPTLSRFLEQRPRQAYDDRAQPFKLAAFLVAGPAIALLARARPRSLALASGAAIVLAQLGRYRGGGAKAFDAVSPILAPAWICERAALSWVAAARRVFRGGCPYAGSVIVRAATPSRTLRRRLRPSAAG